MKVLGYAMVLVLVAAEAWAGEPAKPVECAPSPAFDKLKSLAGEWTLAGGDGSVAAAWKVTANGSAVVETLFPGSPHEMLTVYTLRGADLRLTHYCAAGNQPEMQAEKNADAHRIAFHFTGGAGIQPSKDMHMHSASFAFAEDGSLHEEWGTFAGGKPGDTKVFELKRVAPPTAK